MALARALVNLPKVLLLDEPLGALDLKLRKGLQIELKRIQREVGITFVYVTHDQEEALTMSDRIAVMNRGRIEQVSEPEDVYERPTTTFVAGFIGVSNLMPGVVEDASGGPHAGPARRGRLARRLRQRLSAAATAATPSSARKSFTSRGRRNRPATGGRRSGGRSSPPSTWARRRRSSCGVAGDVPMTVLVPNADEAERGRLPGGGASVHLTWAPEHIHLRQGDTNARRRSLNARKNCRSHWRDSALSFGLAACGSDLGGGGREGDVETAEADGEASGELYVANWPFYIDKDTVPHSRTNRASTSTYREEVDDNNVILHEDAAAPPGRRVGDRDIIVVTDWMAEKMYDLGYLQDFDQDAVAPAKENLVGSLESPSFDPERDYSLPWQSGMTGLVVNTAEAPDIKSISDLFDPKYKGRVTVLTELRDTVPLIMKSEGVDPADATADDWLAAIDELQERGRVRPAPRLHRQQLHQLDGPRRRRGRDRLVGRRASSSRLTTPTSSS